MQTAAFKALPKLKPKKAGAEEYGRAFKRLAAKYISEASNSPGCTVKEMKENQPDLLGKVLFLWVMWGASRLEKVAEEPDQDLVSAYTFLPAMDEALSLYTPREFMQVFPPAKESLKGAGKEKPGEAVGGQNKESRKAHDLGRIDVPIGDSHLPSFLWNYNHEAVNRYMLFRYAVIYHTCIRQGILRFDLGMIGEILREAWRAGYYGRPCSAGDFHVVAK